MYSPVAKKLSVLGLVILFSACLSMLWIARASALPCNPGDSSCSRPYIKAGGSDVETGGWFDNGVNSCLGSGVTNYYQDSNYSSGGASNTRYGGILTYAQSSGGGNSAGGSSSEFAAYALGLIEGPTPQVAGSGFYSGGNLANDNPVPSISVGYTSFSNTANAPWGGLLVPQGQPRQASFCVPDYFGTKFPSGPLPPPLGNGLGSNRLKDNTPSGVYYENVGAANIFPLMGTAGGSHDVQLDKPGRQITVFINGNVYIDGNLSYGTTGPCDTNGSGSDLNAGCVTKFALVVKGSVYIAPNVTNLSGLYIVQPDISNPDPVNNDTGAIWTCHPNSTTLPNDSYYSFFPQCQNKLTVSGAFIAKRIQSMRVNNNDVTASNIGEDGYPNTIASNASEVVNYSPDMVIGGPFFIVNGSGSSDNPKIDSLISLPPVF